MRFVPHPTFFGVVLSLVCYAPTFSLKAVGSIGQISPFLRCLPPSSTLVADLRRQGRGCSGRGEPRPVVERSQGRRCQSHGRPGGDGHSEAGGAGRAQSVINGCWRVVRTSCFNFGTSLPQLFCCDFGRSWGHIASKADAIEHVSTLKVAPSPATICPTRNPLRSGDGESIRFSQRRQGLNTLNVDAGLP